MTATKAQELLRWLIQGSWIEKLGEEESSLLSSYLLMGSIRQRRQIALAYVISDGVLYALYAVRYNRERPDIVEIITPGQVVVHREREALPLELVGVPRLAFSTLAELARLKRS